ncbi:MAG TPA: hypothetical protein VFQ23_25980 [Anaerolineales bacterium]|nr:hypothetical protein [Anaerolineales bacterium]
MPDKTISTEQTTENIAPIMQAATQSIRAVRENSVKHSAKASGHRFRDRWLKPGDVKYKPKQRVLA